MKGVRSGVERRRGVSGLKARDERRETPGKVLKKRRSPRVRGRMGTSVRVRRTHLTAGPSAPASRIARVSAMHGRRSRRCTGNVSPSLVVTRTTSLASAASAATESLARVFELATTKPPPRVTTSSRSPSPSACTMNVVRSRATPRKQWYPSVVAAAVAGRVFTDTTRARIGGNASSSPPPPPPSIMIISPAHTHRSRSRAERCAATASPSTSTSASSSSSSSVSSSSSFSSSSPSSSPPPPPPPPFPPASPPPSSSSQQPQLDLRVRERVLLLVLHDVRRERRLLVLRDVQVIPRLQLQRAPPRRHAIASDRADDAVAAALQRQQDDAPAAVARVDAVTREERVRGMQEREPGGRRRRRG